MKKKVILATILFFALNAASASLSLTLSSLAPITQGESSTVTANVQTVGGAVNNVTLTLGALPTGLSTSDSLVQSIGNLSSGQSSSKSWTISGDSSGTYTLTVTATGSSVNNATSSTSLTVNQPAFIEIENFSCNSSSINVGEQLTTSFNLKNTGGSSATVTADADFNSSIFSVSKGSDPWSSDINANTTSSVTWVFSTSEAGSSQTITANISSTANNPSNPSCTVTINAVCGDSLCSNTESCSSCSTDCGQCSSDSNTSSSSSSNNTSSSSSSNNQSSNSDNTSDENTNPKTNIIVNKSIEIEYSKQKAEQLLSKANVKPAGGIVSTPVKIKRTLRVEKKLSDQNKEVFTSTFFLEVENDSGQEMKNIKVVEEVPKTIAQTASEIKSSEPFTVIKGDPIIEFAIADIKTGEKKQVSYSVDKNLDINTLNDFNSPALYLEQDLCKNVECTQTQCKSFACNVKTGKCELQKTYSGITCGTKGTCVQGKCVESKKTTKTKTPEPAKDKNLGKKQQAELNKESKNGFEMLGQVLKTIIILAVLGIILAFAYNYYEENKKPKKAKSLKDVKKKMS